MKKLFALLLALVLCFSLVACGGEKKDDAKGGDEKVLKIGVLEPQTGGSSFVGLNQIAGIKAALADWEEHYGNPGGYKIELVIGDSQSSADVGVTEAERLITSEGCKAIIGWDAHSPDWFAQPTLLERAESFLDSLGIRRIEFLPLTRPHAS